MWVFGKCFQYDHLHLKRNFWRKMTQGRWIVKHMLHGNFSIRAIKGTRTAQPLEDSDGQRVLVAGGTRLASRLLCSDVRDSFRRVTYSFVRRTIGSYRKAKMG